MLSESKLRADLKHQLLFINNIKGFEGIICESACKSSLYLRIQSISSSHFIVSEGYPFKPDVEPPPKGHGVMYSNLKGNNLFHGVSSGDFDEDCNLLIITGYNNIMSVSCWKSLVNENCKSPDYEEAVKKIARRGLER